MIQSPFFFAEPLSNHYPEMLQPTTLVEMENSKSFICHRFGANGGVDSVDKIQLGQTSSTTPSNFVVERDELGRPTVWKIGSMVRRISYLPDGKIRLIEDSGELSALATANGKPAYLLSFGTHDGGRTYIGRMRSEDDIEPLIMTDLQLRGDGTLVATDESGMELSWNPNNGDATVSFVHRNNQRELWTDHLDGSVTTEFRFTNRVVVVMRGKQTTEFCPASITISCPGRNFEIMSSAQDDSARFIAIDLIGSAHGKLDMTMVELGRLLMQSSLVDVEWNEDDRSVLSLRIGDSVRMTCQLSKH